MEGVPAPPAGLLRNFDVGLAAMKWSCMLFCGSVML